MTASPKEAWDSWGMKKTPESPPEEYHKAGWAQQPNSQKGNSHTCVHSTNSAQIPGRCRPIRSRLQDQDAVCVENLPLWDDLICSCQLHLIWEKTSCQQTRALRLWKAELLRFQCHSPLLNASANVSSKLPSKCCSTTCFIGANESRSKS